MTGKEVIVSMLVGRPGRARRDDERPLVIGHTSNAPSIATLTAGTGIAITNGAGFITIAAQRRPGYASSAFSDSPAAAT